MKYSTLFTVLITFILMNGMATAEVSDDKENIDHYVEQLDKISFLPGLLSVIFENSDVIGLTGEQLDTLLAWSNSNEKLLIETSNNIARKRAEIKQAAISPNISSARLIQIQNEIFRLQRAMLEHKLSCRELVINTFNRKNWDGFFLVLADKDTGIALPEFYVTQK